MNRSSRPWIVTIFLLAVSPALLGQGRLEDYQRAQRFLPGNLKHLVYIAEVDPHWIEKTNRFFARRRWDYFVQYLLDVTPPANFEIKEDPEVGRNGRRRR